MPSHASKAATAYVLSASTVDSFITQNNTVITTFTTQNVTSGNLIAVYVHWDLPGSTLNNVNDDCGNTYIIVPSTLVTGFADNPNPAAEGAYAKNVKGGSKCKVTATFSANINVKTIIIHEISGADPVQPLDASVGTATQRTSGTDALKSNKFATNAKGDY